MRGSTIVKLARAGGIAVVIIILAFLLYDHWRPDCDGLFEQTTARFGGHMEVIHNQGDLVIGREKVQELTDGSQKIALHLKFCCIEQHSGAMDGGALERCAAGAKEYDNKIVQVATNIRDAQAAKEQGNTDVAEKKEAEAKAVTEAAISTVPPADPAPSGGKSKVPAAVSTGAQEPNTTILQAKAAQMGTAILGEISSDGNAHYFRFQFQDDKHRRDVVSVHLENLSSTLQPSLGLFKEDKSRTGDEEYANASGANLDSSFTAEPRKSYYVAVGSKYGSAGNYKHTVTPLKAYDAFEPNNDAFSAAPLGIGQTVEANIMVGDENDWYHLTGITAESIAVNLENLSTTLQPSLKFFNEDKSMAGGKYINAPGANLASSFTAEPGKSYYVVVGSTGGSAGNYKLTVR